MRRASARPQFGRVSRQEVEAEAAVVEVDLRVRLDEPGAEAGGVRLDERHAHPFVVDRAQVGRVAPVLAGAEGGGVRVTRTQ